MLKIENVVTAYQTLIGHYLHIPPCSLSPSPLLHGSLHLVASRKGTKTKLVKQSVSSTASYMSPKPLRSNIGQHADTRFNISKPLSMLKNSDCDLSARIPPFSEWLIDGKSTMRGGSKHLTTRLIGLDSCFTFHKKRIAGSEKPQSPFSHSPPKRLLLTGHQRPVLHSRCTRFLAIWAVLGQAIGPKHTLFQ